MHEAGPYGTGHVQRCPCTSFTSAPCPLQSLFSGATGAARLEHLLFVADKFKGQELELEALRLAADQLAAASNVKLHREVLERIGGRLGPAYVLDR